jgi:hypothetical protein
MKDRLITLALALGALALFYAFMAPKPDLAEPQLSLPLSTESGDDGYLALWRWLRDQKLPVRALRQPFTRLEDAGYSPSASGNVLFTTMPHRVGVQGGELQALERWIERGNTLVVAAALDDTPAWALRADESFLRNLARMTFLQFDTIQSSNHDSAGGSRTSSGTRFIEALRRTLNPEPLLIVPRGPSPLFRDVRSVVATSPYPASRWKATSLDVTAVLEPGQRADTRHPENDRDAALWLRPQGKGQILVLGFATPFSNRMLGEGDNGRLFSNIIAWSRAAGGTIWFDDDHQGATDYYDAKAFFRDPRLHRTIGWLIALWLVFVLGWQRMRAPDDPWSPRDVTAFVRTTGEFLAGAATRKAVGRRLFENFFLQARRRLSLTEGEGPAWDLLAADARIGESDLAQLRAEYARIESGERFDLVRLHNLLSRITGKFA